MVGDGSPRAGTRTATVLPLPFRGLWLVQNSPSRRVPSHGTNLMGERYAIDFVGVDDRLRSAGMRDWRTYLATEPPERFVGFGREVLAPAGGVVVAAHDGEPDHAARRSQLALLPYALGQAARLRRGPDGIAGNHVIIAVDGETGFLALVHLRAGSLRVAAGQKVATGEQLAECGNSGNSTQPHLHVQLMDSLDFPVARGIPLEFSYFREWRRGRPPLERSSGLPAERSVVEPLHPVAQLSP